MDERERERAVDELIELVAAVDGLLQAQTDHDLANFQTSIGRRLGPAERAEVRGGGAAAPSAGRSSRAA